MLIRLIVLVFAKAAADILVAFAKEVIYLAYTDVAESKKPTFQAGFGSY